MLSVHPVVVEYVRYAVLSASIVSSCVAVLLAG